MRPFALCLIPLLGCATARLATPTTSTAQLVADAREARLPFENPLELKPAQIAIVLAKIDNSGNELTRMRRIAHYIDDDSGLNFQYEPTLSLTAAQAFEQRRGDCVAYSNLFTAIARTLGVPTRFVRVTEAPTYFEQAGTFFVSSHIALSEGVGSDLRVFDFKGNQSEWRRLALYHPIDDSSAVALYFANLAVDRMVAGDNSEAERIFRFLIARAPSLVELYSNLAVAQMHQGHDREALETIERGIAVDPSFRPLYVNGLRAAQRAGFVEYAQELEVKARALAGGDPVLLYNLGRRLYEAHNYAAAARQLSRAVDAEPSSLILWTWLIRAEVAGGLDADAALTLGHLAKLFPHDRVLAELRNEFPAVARHEWRPDTQPQGGPRLRVPMSLMPPVSDEPTRMSPNRRIL